MTRNKNTPTSVGDGLLGAVKDLPTVGFSRWDTLRCHVPFSRETLRKYEKEGRFPRRIYLTERCVVWSNRELHLWFADPVNYRADA